MSANVFNANGKLLLSGEYFVLDGALSIGLPTSKGQKIVIKESSGSEIHWESYSPNGDNWFKGKFDLFGFDVIKTSDEEMANKLKRIFIEAVRLNSEFLSKWKKYKISTFLDFQKDWGLGSSSTLVACIAHWADVDPFELQFNTFGGSGYDIACAEAKGPIFYQVDEDHIESRDCPFSPSFRNQLYFIYLGRKQDTQEGIEHYQQHSIGGTIISDISAISNEISNVSDLKSFDKLIVEHEQIVAKELKLDRLQKLQFNDYWGTIKSLGAWGGDFAMVSSDRPEKETIEYFKSKGIDTIFRYDDLILSKK